MTLSETDSNDKQEEGGGNQNADVYLLSSNLSTEIENELKPMLGFTNLLLAGEFKKADNKEILSEIRNRAHEIHSITIRLRELSSLLLGNYDLKFENFDLQIILGGIQEKFKKINKIRGNTLKIKDKQKEENFLIYTDKNAVTKIILNLVKNAINFTKNGEILIRTEIVEEKYLELLVKDTVIGIPEEYQQKIYDPFFLANNNSQGGLGIGLAIIKAYINKLGGEINVNSGINGSSFKVLIPIKINKSH